MREDTLPPPVDDADFNDPDAWGYCMYCAYQVAKFRGEDKLFFHQRGIGNAATEHRVCSGSGGPAGIQTAPEMAPHLDGGMKIAVTPKMVSSSTATVSGLTLQLTEYIPPNTIVSGPLTQEESNGEDVEE